jgi:hypothetical protein
MRNFGPYSPSFSGFRQLTCTFAAGAEAGLRPSLSENSPCPLREALPALRADGLSDELCD